MTSGNGAEQPHGPAHRRHNNVDLIVSAATIAESLARIAAAALAIHALRTTRACARSLP